MIERIEVTAGPGTVLRYGSIVAWTDLSASPALISFLAQSARNLGPSPRGGRQIADHIAGILAVHDPEPQVAFAVIGPSDHGWASLLHGPVQAWDGARWLAPTPNPGWLQAIITARPAITVSAAGSPTPSVHPDAMWDLEAGVVPGAGFVLVPGGVPGGLPVLRPAGGEGREVTGLTAAMVDADTRAPAAAAATTVLPAEAATMAMIAGGVLVEAAPPEPDVDADADTDTTVGPAVATVAPTEAEAAAEPEPEPEPEPDTPAEPTGSAQPALPPPPPAIPGPPGSLDLRAVPVTAGRPLAVGTGADQRTPGAAVVAGVLCARGHLNRPGLRACARCRIPLPVGSPDKISGTRPPLGVLVVDDGTVYRLDRGYLVGSNSLRDPTVGGGLARPLHLAGSDVSGSHAEVRLNDWDVIVVDRGSTAGTCVFEPGTDEWQRLNPYEPRVIAPGTHVAFGQRIVTWISPWVAGG